MRGVSKGDKDILKRSKGVLQENRGEMKKRSGVSQGYITVSRKGSVPDRETRVYHSKKELLHWKTRPYGRKERFSKGRQVNFTERERCSIRRQGYIRDGRGV